MTPDEQHRAAARILVSAGVQDPTLEAWQPLFQTWTGLASAWSGILKGRRVDVFLQDVRPEPWAEFARSAETVDLSREGARLANAVHRLDPPPTLEPWLAVSRVDEVLVWIRASSAIEPLRGLTPHLPALALLLDELSAVLPFGLYLRMADLGVRDGHLQIRNWGLESFARVSLARNAETRLGDDTLGVAEGLRKGWKLVPELSRFGATPAHSLVQLWLESYLGARPVFAEQLEPLAPALRTTLLDCLSRPTSACALVPVLEAA
ncbi:MAG: hypothetical protein AAGE52_05095 [Myxococcota bacterium]